MVAICQMYYPQSVSFTELLSWPKQKPEKTADIENAFQCQQPIAMCQMAFLRCYSTVDLWRENGIDVKSAGWFGLEDIQSGTGLTILWIVSKAP